MAKDKRQKIKDFFKHTKFPVPYNTSRKLINERDVSTLIRLYMFIGGQCPLTIARCLLTFYFFKGSAILAAKNCLFILAMLVTEMPFGHSAIQA